LKSTYFILISAIALLACSRQAKKETVHDTVTPKAAVAYTFHKLNKLYVVGDFDGDKKQDTLFQHTCSASTKKKIDSAPDPFHHEWYNVVQWLSRQDAAVYITMRTVKPDTLQLGFGARLYCLINIGDNNSDGREEIAVVTDYADFSNVNTCRIYSLCKGKWTVLKAFGVHESSFEFTGHKQPVFNKIRNFLEKQNGKWMYTSYEAGNFNRDKGEGKLQPLSVGKCR